MLQKLDVLAGSPFLLEKQYGQEGSLGTSTMLV